MSDESNAVLTAEIDRCITALEGDGVSACAGHKHVAGALTTLLLCEKARLQAQSRVVSAASVGGGLGGVVAGAVSYFAAKYFTP